MAGEDGEYSYDTEAMRDVANNDMTGMDPDRPSIALDIEDARTRFGVTTRPANEAFRGYTSSAFGLTLADSPFAVVGEKWNRASVGIAVGMATSQGRVNDAAENLRQTADDYDAADTRAAAEFDGLLRLLNDR